MLLNYYKSIRKTNCTSFIIRWLRPATKPPRRAIVILKNCNIVTYNSFHYELKKKKINNNNDVSVTPNLHCNNCIRVINGIFVEY